LLRSTVNALAVPSAVLVASSAATGALTEGRERASAVARTVVQREMKREEPSCSGRPILSAGEGADGRDA